MCLIFSKILGLPHAHIIPDAEPYTVSTFSRFFSYRPLSIADAETEARLGGGGDNAPTRLPSVHTRDRGTDGGPRWPGLESVRRVVDNTPATQTVNESGRSETVGKGVMRMTGWKLNERTEKL